MDFVTRRKYKKKSCTFVNEINYTAQLEKRKFIGLNLESLIFTFPKIMTFQYGTFLFICI